jgi:hypothetical protein
MPGLLFYDSIDSVASIAALRNLGVRYRDRYSLDNAAYRAQYYVGSGVYPENPEEYRAAFDFCYDEETALNCTILSFVVAELLSYSVTESYYEITPGACTDTFSIPDDKW